MPRDSRAWEWAWAVLRGEVLSALEKRRRAALLRLAPFVVLEQEHP